ncbi:unnamed protein product [Toxocara canis]|uniref:DUF4328 domain-containing protein n=1 Tax=Toxocara canis TaxID=6265 RepID=A0A183US72_TOXCA|nr:unnamed protein product [Toxocara canis]
MSGRFPQLTTLSAYDECIFTLLPSYWKDLSSKPPSRGWLDPLLGWLASLLGWLASLLVCVVIHDAHYVDDLAESAQDKTGTASFGNN